MSIIIQQQNVPRLRFSEFDGKWKNKHLNDFGEIISGYPVSGDEILETKTDTPLLRGINITEGRIRHSLKIDRFHGGDISSLTKFMTEEGDIVIGMDGSKVGKNVAIIKKADARAFLIQRVARIRKIEKNSLDFSFHHIFSKRFHKYVDRINTSSGIPHISLKQLRDFPIIAPEKIEQQKIASFLSSVDKKIEQMDKKKKLLEQYKKGMMQKLFTQQISFKDGNGNDYQDWEEKRLEDILFEHKTTNHTNNISEVFSVSKHKGVINQIEHLGRSYAADSISHYKVANPFDVIYTKSPTSEFPFGIIKQNLTERSGVVSPLYAVFRPLNQHVGYILHTHFLSWVNTYNYLNPLVQKGAKNTMSIRNDDFLNGAKINFPNSTEEQTKIANFLASLDNKINLVTAELIQAQTFKKGLLQQMLKIVGFDVKLIVRRENA